MMRNRSWLAGLASKIFPRRFAAARRASRRRQSNASRNALGTSLVSETLEPRHLLTVNFLGFGQGLGGGEETYDVAIGDLNNDGTLDVMTGVDGTANRIFLHDGTDAYFFYTDEQELDGTKNVALGDFDADGDLDGVSGSHLYINDGSANFTVIDAPGDITSTDSIVVGDIDGDTDLDILVSDTSSDPTNEIHIWTNDGSGNFTTTGVTFGGRNSRDLELGDLDGDNDLDLFVANTQPSNPDTVYLNDGSGNFIESQLMNNGDSDGAVLGDFDGDTDIDIFVAVAGSGANKVWLNDGSGTFTDSGQSLGNSDSRDAAAGDIDLDGDIDIVVANENGQANTLWLNDGSGVFTHNRDFGINEGSTCQIVALGDFDGDGVLDVFAGNRGNSDTPYRTYLMSVSDLLHTLDDPTLAAGDNQFGYAVAIDGNRILVGAPNDATVADAAGQAHLYDRTTGTLLQTFDDPAATALDFFGAAVAIEGDNIVIGAYGDDTNGSAVGRAYLYSATTGNLLQTFDDPTPGGGDLFGISVAISGNNVLVGAYLDDTNGTNVGQAHLFDATTGNLVRTFDDPTPTHMDQFGYSVAIHGTTALIGAPWHETSDIVRGEAHLFDTATGNLLQTFDNPAFFDLADPSSSTSLFAWSVAIDGSSVLIGDCAYVDQTLGSTTGAAYLYNSDSANLVHAFFEPTRQFNDIYAFGFSVALEGENLLIGCEGDDTNGNNIGQAHLFDATSGNLIRSFDDPTPTYRDQFGYAVAIDGQSVVIGAPRDDTQGTEVGQAHLFTIGPSNQAPVFDDQYYDLHENSADGSVVWTFPSQDVDGDLLSYAITSGADPDNDGNQAFRIEGNQLVVNDPGDLDHEADPQLTVTVEASDDGGLTDSAQITVNVSNVLEAPIALDDTYQLPPDSFVTIAAPGVLVNDNSIESDAPTVVRVSDVTHGTLSLAADGSFFYEPATAFTGTDSFTYQANDSFNLSSVATVTLEVGPADAPAIDPLSLSVVENSADGTLVGTFSSTNPNGGTLTYAIRSGSDPDGDGNQAFRIEGDQLLVNDTGDLNYEIDPLLSLVVTVTDGTYGTVSAIDVTVSDINEAPVLTPAASPTLGTVAEDAGLPSGAVGVLVASLIETGGVLDNFADEDGDAAGIAIVGTNVSGGTLWFSLDDGASWSNVGGVSEASARVLYADAATRLYYEPAADFNGTLSDVLTLKAWDRTGGAANGEGGVDTSRVGWRQMGSDIGPKSNQRGNGKVGSAISLSRDGSTIAIGDQLHSDGQAYVGNTRVFQWDGASWTLRGEDLFYHWRQADDRFGAAVALNESGNTAAVIAPPSEYFNTDGISHTRIYRFSGSGWNQLGGDIDGEAPWDSFTGSEVVVSLSSDGNTVAIGAIYNDGNGVDSGHTRIYRWDGSVWSQLGNDIDGRAAGDNSGSSVSLSSDGNTVAIGDAGHGSADPGRARIYRWDGTAWNQLGGDFVGEMIDSPVGPVGESLGQSVSLSSDGNIVAIGIPCLNRWWGDVPDSEWIDAGRVRLFMWDGVTWNQLGSDIHGEAAGDAAGGSVSLSSDGGTIAVGAHSNDANGTFSGHTRIYRWDGVDWNQVGGDLDGENTHHKSGSIVSLSGDGSRVAIGTPGAGTNSINSLLGHVRIYSVFEDDSFSTDTDTVSVTVAPVNDPPSITSPAEKSVVENSTAVTTVAAIDIDSGDSINFSISGGDDGGLFEIDPDSGVLTFVTAPDFESPASSGGTNTYEVQVTATDSGGLQAVQLLSVTVTDVNEAPVILDQTFAVDENSAEGTIIGTLVGSDEDGNSLTYSITSNVDPDDDGNDAFRIEGNQLLVNDAGDFNFENNSQLIVTVEVSDANLTDTAQVTVDVNNVNEAPVLTPDASPSLGEVAEDAGPPSGAVGALVASLIETGGVLDNFADEDGDAAGMAIVGTALQGGTLWFSLDDGGSWSEVGAVSEAAARVLYADAATRLYYEPAADFNGTLSDVLTLKAWDRTGGAANGEGGIDTIQLPAWEQLGSDIDGEAAEDQSGSSVAINDDGTIIAVAAPGNEGSGSYSGHTRIYQWDGVTWNQLGSDIDGEDFSNSGTSISLSSDGHTLAVGAPGEDETRIYRWDGVTWNQLGSTINGEADYTDFGTAVALSDDGTTVAVGAPRNSEVGTNAGHARIYRWNGTSWAQLGNEIDGEAAWDRSGEAIAISSDGNTVVIGARNNEGTDYYAGHARIFRWNGFTWNQLGSDIDGESINDNSGFAVSLASDGNTVAIGAPGNSGNGTYAGHTRILSWNGSTWEQLGDDIDGATTWDRSGSSVSLSADGKVVAVGATADYSSFIYDGPGHARIYRWNGTAWNQVASDIAGESPLDEFGGAVAISEDGSVVVVGARENAGNGNDAGHTRVFRYVDDNSFSTATDTVSVTVTPVNDPPSINSPAAVNAAENGTAVTTIAAIDVDTGDSIGFAITGGDDGGLFEIDPDSGVLTFRTAPDFETPTSSAGSNVYEVEVTATDSTSLTAVQLLSVTVTDVNEAPEIQDQTFDVDENSADGTLVGVIVASDVDAGAVLSYAFVEGNESGDANAIAPFRIAGNQLLVNDPAAFNFESVSQFELTISVSDGSFTDTAQVTVDVNNVNDAPQITSSATPSAAENTTSVTTVAATDEDAGDTWQFSVTGGADSALFGIDPDSGVLTFLTPPDFEAPTSSGGTNIYEVQVTTTDDGGLTAVQLLSVTVTGVNEAPEIQDQTFAVDENSAEGTIIGTLVGSDVDGDPRTYAITSDVDPDGDGNDAFRIEGNQLLVNDADDFDHEVNAQLIVTVEVSDGNLTDSAELTVQINDVNDRPTMNQPLDQVVLINATEQEVVLGGISAGGESQLLAITAQSSNTSLVPHPEVRGYVSPAANASLFFTPVADQVGQAVITITVTDAGFDGLLETTEDNGIYDLNFMVTVQPPNQPPVVEDQTFSVAENSTAGTEVGQIVATDFEFDELNYSLSNVPDPDGDGVVAFTNVGNQILVLDPDDLDFETQPSLDFTITVDDGELQDTAIVTVNVTDANDAPTVAAISDLVLAENNAAFWLKISGLTDGGDAGAEPLAISATSSNPALIADPAVQYQQGESSALLSLSVDQVDQSGSADITVTIIDGGADLDLATLEDNATTSETFTVTVSSDQPTDYIIIDNQDAGYSEGLPEGETGNIGLSTVGGTQGSVSYGGDARRAYSKYLRGFAQWQATDLAPGAYQVSLTWPTGWTSDWASKHESNVPVSVSSPGSSYSVAVDQASVPADRSYQGAEWHDLGLIGVSSGELVVQMGPAGSSYPGGKFAFADAVLITAQPQSLVLQTDAATIFEQGGSTVATVTRPAAITGEIVVQLAVSETGVLQVPDSVIIPADQQSATFDITAIDNAVAEPSPTVSVLAITEAYLPGVVTLTITDDDTPTLDPLANVSMPEGGTQNISLIGISSGVGASEPIEVRATSSNLALLPDPQVSYESGDTTGSLLLEPVATEYGTAMVTVVVEDGGADQDLATPADNGIVSETFTVEIVRTDDFGDAPAPYPVILAQDGARHGSSQPVLTLGSVIDEEVDGQPSGGADGEGADDDGVTFGVLKDGLSASVDVLVAGNAGYIDAWIDWNADGDWNDAGEKIFDTRSVAVGMQTLAFDVPADATIGTTYARFRLSSAGGLDVTGLVADGEVEDYQVEIERANPLPTLDAFAFTPLLIDEDADTQTVQLTGISAGSGDSQPLRVTAESSNANLIPDPTVTYQSPDASGLIEFAPLANQFGTVQIEVTVEDGGLDNDLATPGDNARFSHSFEVVVNGVNDAPVISDQSFTVPENSAAGTVIGTLTATDIDGTTATYNHLNFFTDFESGLPAQFSGTSNSIESVQGYDQVGDFSGSFLRNSSTGNPAAATTVTFTDLAPHEYVNLDFLLAIIDSWNGDDYTYGPDNFNVTVDGVPVFSQTFSNRSGETQGYAPPAGVLLGRGDFGWLSDQDAAYNMGLDPTFTQIPHTASTLTVSWYASGDGWQGNDNESWAIENLSITTTGDPIVFTLDGPTDFDGDGNDAFRIEGDQLIVNDPDDFDFEGTNPIVVTVSASDGADSSSADVTVNLTDVPDTPGSISGTFWHDLDEDGTQNGSEPALAGWTAYIDANLNGTLDAGEVTTTSDTNGDYSFAGLDAGTYVIGQVLQSNWTQTYPGLNSTGSSASQRMTLATAVIETSALDVASASYEVDIDDLHEDTESEIISCYWPPSDDFSTNNITENLQPASYPLNETFLLHSNPGASKVIYLDFDGHVTTGTPWNDSHGATIITPAYSFEGDSSFSDTELQRIQNIWERVAEDFVPFNVNVTTEDPGVEALRDTGSGDVEWGTRVAIGGSSSDWFNDSALGVAYSLESFVYPSDTPGFVFSGQIVAGYPDAETEKMVAIVASHEVGHTLGLSHDGLSGGTAYYEGHGSGPTSWGPIMGKGGQYRSLAHWSKGEYSSADNAEDDLAIITSNNGFGYRADDHGNGLIDATSLSSSGNTLVVTSGIIEKNTDQDFFAFATSAGEVNIQIDPFYRAPNLDILATLYDASGTVVATSNPIGQIDAAFNETLTAGFYSISIEGTGEGDVLGEGYSDYGSLGYYEISGTIINPAISDSHTVTLEWTEDVTGIDFGNRVGDSPTLDDQSVTVAENTAEQTVVASLSATVANFALTIDNSESGFTSTSEFVYLNNPNKTAEAYNGDNHFAQNETTGQATWTFNSLPGGEYRVASTWSHQYENKYNAIDAPFTILDGVTPVGSATINQRITPDDFTAEGYGWETLDEVVVTSGSLVVNLGVGSANPNNSTVADAIRIERIGPAAALTYSVLNGVDPDGDGSDAFRIEDDQIVVNDSGELDYEASSQLIFTVQVSDGTLTDSAQITVDLTDVNERPVIAAPNDQSHTEGDVVSLALVASDPENDPLTWTATDLPPGLLIDDSTGAITGTLTGDSSGSYATEISVTDGSLTDTVLFSWSVVEGDDPPVITLIGASQLTVEASSTGSYSDPGATASDEEDGDLSGSILVSGQLVNLAVIGTYVLNYDVQDSVGNDAETVSRTVLVQDTLAPVITLTGSETTLIEAGFPYTDAGATASDSLDGEVSGSIVVSGDVVDVATTGSYTVLYNVQDAAGNAADQVTRTVTVQDTLRPVISMTYSGEVLQVSDHADTGLGGEANSPAGLPSETELNAVGSAGRLQTPIVRTTDYTQPDGSPVESRQEWLARSPAGEVSSVPVGAAWDHGDSSIVPGSTIVIIDRDGTPLDETVGAVDFDTRSTYLFEYDAVDDSGNYAEQVVFALILDDQAAPTITVVGGNSETVEAASGWTLSEATATDNIDGDLTATILYSVENVSTSTTLGTDLTYAQAAALFDTTQVGNYLVTIQVSDAAGIYGLNNSNNLAMATKAVAIQDTLAPVITLTGDSMINLPQTIGGTYSDPGATAVDALDGDLTGSVVVGGDVVDLEQDGAYVITYNVQDNAGNAAEQITRTVNVIPVVVEDVVVLDDGEAGFAENGFTHQSNAQVAAAYDGDVHHMQGGTGEASWTFTGLPADRYQVAATWAFKYNNNYNATDAPFTLSDGAGGVFSTQIINQKNAPAEFEDAGYFWDTLDTVEVSGGTLVVTLGAGSAANKYVVADAIRVSVAATLTLSINDASVAESAGTAATTATVTRNGPTDYPVDVDLLVSDATEISVPATVTIPAGQASASFSIDAVDDVFFDGSQNVNVLATAIGYSDGSDSLEILDDETAHTALIDDGEAGFAQIGFSYQSNAQVAAAYNGDNYWLRNGDDTDQASWTFTGLDDGAYHVMATWSHVYNNNYNATDAPFQMLDAGSNVLSSVVINQKNAPSQHDVSGYFWDTLDTVYVAGGELTVTLGPSAVANKYVVADAVRIEQIVQSTPVLTVQLGDEIASEDAGTVTGIVSRGAETVGDLVVSLASDDPATGTVPAIVTIPDGAGSVAFTLSVVDDAVVDGDQQVAVTATAVGYTGGSDSLLVEDDEFPPVQIMDDGDAGFSTSGGFKDRSWATAYGGDNHNMRGGDGEARWRFTDLIDGEYTVSVTWDHISSNVYNATDAPFTIRNAADEQLLAAAVDQTLSPADFSDGVTDWHTLGTVYVIDGELTVSLTETLVNKYVVADAVRLEIDTNPSPKLLVILDDSSVSEAGTVNGKVIRTGDTAGSLTVNLASDNADAATVPDTITLGEGARYGTFTINPTDDSAPDGIQVTNIGASAEGFAAGTAALDVVDDDATILFVDNGEDGFVADAGFKRRNVVGAYQNDNHYMRGGTGEASWTFTGLEEGQYFVSTTWNHIWDNRYNTERAPFSIRNGSGNLLSTLIVDQTQTPADFTDGGYGWKGLAPVYINDGTLVVTLGASPTNHHAVADAIRIELNESLAPSLFVLVDSESESAGSATGTVVRTGDTSSEAVVGLTSSNHAAATVESSITFAIGESTKSFAVTPTDDSSPDGIQQSTIEATAASYAAGTAVLNVQDDDALEVAIMDNTDNGYTSNGFRYNANKQVSDAYGGNNESLKGGEPGEEASWTFTGLADGVYHVSATWNHQYDNNYNATDAQYSITNAADEALATTTINQSNAPSEFLDNGIAWGTLDTVTVTGGELIVTVSGGSNQNRHTVADAVRIARVAELGGSSMQSAEADPFYDPLEDALDDLAGEWGETSADEESLLWGE